MVERKDCPMRNQDNGNCLPVGGSCTAVNDSICEAVRSAYTFGGFNICRHINEQKYLWFQIFTGRIRDYSEGGVWSDGLEILCKTESAADAISDLLRQLYQAQGEDVTVVTGYYDPEEDERNDEQDRYTGWWYVYVE